MISLNCGKIRHCPNFIWLTLSQRENCFLYYNKPYLQTKNLSFGKSLLYVLYYVKSEFSLSVYIPRPLCIILMEELRRCFVLKHLNITNFTKWNIFSLFFVNKYLNRPPTYGKFYKQLNYETLYSFRLSILCFMNLFYKFLSINIGYQRVNIIRA